MWPQWSWVWSLSGIRGLRTSRGRRRKAALRRGSLKSACKRGGCRRTFPFRDGSRFPDAHKVPWINDALSALWPYVKLYMRNYVTDHVEPILEASRPPMVSKWSFSNFDLGRAAPIINSVRTFKVENEEFIFDIDLKLRTIDSLIVFDVALAGIVAPVELAYLEFEGTLRVSLSKFMPDATICACRYLHFSAQTRDQF